MQELHIKDRNTSIPKPTGGIMTFFAKFKKYFNYSFHAARADLRSEVSKSYLNWLWWVLEPFFQMVTYYIVFGYIFKRKEEYFIVFLFSGLTMWTFFSRTMTQSVRLMVSKRSIIIKTYVPKHALLAERMMVNAFKMFVSWGFVVLLMLFYRIPVDWHLLGLVPIMVVFFMFSYGCASILMHFGVYVDDLSYVVSILLNMVFYFTGIFYSIRDRVPAPLNIYAERLNPMAFFISAARDCLMHKRMFDPYVLLAWFGISLLIVLFGIKLISKYENSYAKVI